MKLYVVVVKQTSVSNKKHIFTTGTYFIVVKWIMQRALDWVGKLFINLDQWCRPEKLNNSQTPLTLTLRGP